MTTTVLIERMVIYLSTWFGHISGEHGRNVKPWWLCCVESDMECSERLLNTDKRDKVQASGQCGSGRYISGLPEDASPYKLHGSLAGPRDLPGKSSVYLLTYSGPSPQCRWLHLPLHTTERGPRWSDCIPSCSIIYACKPRLPRLGLRPRLDKYMLYIAYIKNILN